MSGFVRLHRDITDNELWLLEPFTKAQAWVDLFMCANWKPGALSIRGNIVKIGRGQLGWSEMSMSKRWRWSRDKVRRFLSYLESNGNIRQQKSSLTTIVTICNYDKYQPDNTAHSTAYNTADDTAERQQKDSRRYTIEEGKEGKEGKEKIIFARENFSDTCRKVREAVCKIQLSPADFEVIKSWGDFTKEEIDAACSTTRTRGGKTVRYIDTVLRETRNEAVKSAKVQPKATSGGKVIEDFVPDPALVATRKMFMTMKERCGLGMNMPKNEQNTA